MDLQVRAQIVVANGEPDQKLDPDTRAEAAGGGNMIEGIASSTSIDFYGTEMSLMGLRSMADQMQRGIPVIPRHQSLTGSGMAEWDEVIGRTVQAEVTSADVMNGATLAEPGYILRSTTMLYSDSSLANQLVTRLDRGEPIGQSIGGWFLSVRVQTNDDGEVDRVIVDQVELDHLAITRAPANPDSNSLVTMRSRAEAFAKDLLPDLETRGPGGSSDLPLAPETMPWSFDAKEQDEVLGDPPDWKRYRSVHAWYDYDKPEVKGSYKLPYAKVVDGKIQAVWRGVAAAMGALLGARGGVDIPDEDREGVYKLLSNYYKRFDKPVPDFKSYDGKEYGAGDDDKKYSVDENQEYASDPSMNDSACDTTETEVSMELEERTPEQVTDSQDGVTEALDTAKETAQDSDSIETLSNPIPEDAQRSAEPASPPPTLEDESMTESDLLKIDEMISRAVSGLAERFQASEASTGDSPSVAEPAEPSVDTVDDETTARLRTEIEALRAKVAEADESLARVADYGLRHGRRSATEAPQSGPGAGGVWDLMVSRTRDNNAQSVLATFVDSNKEPLAEEVETNTQNRRQLVSTLEAGLRAAAADGLIGNHTVEWR